MTEEPNQAALPNLADRDLNPDTSIQKPMSPLSIFLKENPKEFVKLFSIADLSILDPDEMKAYQASLKIARDNYSHDETVRVKAKLKGKIEGKIEAKHEMALEMLTKKSPLKKLLSTPAFL